MALHYIIRLNNVRCMRNLIYFNRQQITGNKFGSGQLCLPFASCTRNSSNWHVLSAVCVDRRPVIAQGMNSLEKEYFNMLQIMEIENSHLSDHEIQIKQEEKNKEKLKQKELDDIDLDSAVKQSVEDLEDIYEDELKKFIPASRITEDDKNNNKKSLNRALDSYLLLVVKQKLGNDYRWIMPQGIRKGDETLRETAERVLKETCGDHMKVCFLGNSPAGYYKYKYPKIMRQEGIEGAKIFFFKAQWIEGNVSQEETNSVAPDFLWLTRTELKSQLQKKYYNTLKSFLIDVKLPPWNIEDSLLIKCQRKIAN